MYINFTNSLVCIGTAAKTETPAKYIRKPFSSKRRRKPYKKKCALERCRGRAPQHRVFKFPSNVHTAKLWRKACGFPPDLDIINKRLCEKHFPKELMTGKYLPKTTIPTLNLPVVVSEHEETEDEVDDDDDINLSDDVLLTGEEGQPINCGNVANRNVPMDKKKLLIKLFEEGMAIREAANVVEINFNTAKTIIRRYNKSNVVEKKITIPENENAIQLKDYKLDLFEEVDQTEIEIYKTFVSTVQKVLTRKSHCTTCDIHIGTAPINEAIIKMHPLLRVTLCKKCFTFYNTGGFESGEDGSELYCRWCGQGGELYCCSSCPYVFCHNCISLNFPKKMVTEIQNVEDWRCFVCNPKCIMVLRADHWALLNFIEQQKLDVLNSSTDEVQINYRMSKDVSKCCNNRIKRLVIKRKPDNTADIPVPEPKKQALETDTAVELDDQEDDKSSASEPAVLDEPINTPDVPMPETSNTALDEPNTSIEIDREDDIIKPHEPIVVLAEPEITTTPKPVATIRPTGSSEKKTPPPKILNNLLAKRAEAKNQNQKTSSNSSSAQSNGAPALRLLSSANAVPSLVPSSLMLTPTSAPNITMPRQPNPVYHTVNGFCIDLNSAAQQDMYRLPNGKIIQVRRQPQQPQQQITPPQVQVSQPQLQMLQPTFQPQQFIGSYQQLQAMGATIVQQLVPQQNQVSMINKVPPLTLRSVQGNLSVEKSHIQLGQQVSSTVQVYQHMNTKIKTFTNSSAYKNVNTLTDVKDLTMHLTYLLNYSIGRLQTIRKECANYMKIMETEISKDNKIDGDECEIVETNKAPVINLDSDEEESASNNSTITIQNQNSMVSEFVGLPMASTHTTGVQPTPPIPHFNIRPKSLPPLKAKPRPLPTQQNMLSTYTTWADQGGSGDVTVRKIKSEPRSYVTKSGTKLVKLYNSNTSH